MHNRTIYLIANIILVLALFGCSATVTSVKYFNPYFDFTKVDHILVHEPEQEDAEFYSKVDVDILINELEEFFSMYKIKVERGDSLDVPFNQFHSRYLKNEDTKAQLIVVTKIKAYGPPGNANDYKVEYKFYSRLDKNLQFHSKYSTNFDQSVFATYTHGLTRGDELYTIAIKKGLEKFQQKMIYGQKAVCIKT